MNKPKVYTSILRVWLKVCGLEIIATLHSVSMIYLYQDLLLEYTFTDWVSSPLTHRKNRDLCTIINNCLKVIAPIHTFTDNMILVINLIWETYVLNVFIENY